MLEPLISLVRQEGFEPPTHGLEGLPGYFYLFPSRAAPIKSRIPEPYNFIFSIKIHCFLGYSPPYGLLNHKVVATPKIMKLSIIPPASSSAHEAGIFVQISLCPFVRQHESSNIKGWRTPHFSDGQNGQADNYIYKVTSKSGFHDFCLCKETVAPPLQIPHLPPEPHSR